MGLFDMKAINVVKKTIVSFGYERVDIPGFLYNTNWFLCPILILRLLLPQNYWC